MYSQGDEEQIILECLGEFASPSAFLDIGGYHPTELSNTRVLFLRGWSGVVVEPSPEPFLALLKEYGKQEKITLINAVVKRSGDPDLAEIWGSSDAVSTTVPAHYELWKERGGYHGRFFSPGITLRGIFDRFFDVLGNGRLQFVNIDTEGTSADLFLELLALGARPHCICVEHDDRLAELTAYGHAAGYRLHGVTESNGVFSL